MKNTFLVQIFQREQHASNEKPSLFFGEFFMFGQVVSEVAALHQVDYQVKVLSILECIVHIHQKGMVELT